jgi:transketolase
MRKHFYKELVRLGEKDDRIVVMVGDFGVYGLKEFSDKFPTRFINFGIREQAMIGVSAGMAHVGLRPIVHSIAPFLVERPYEQIKLDLCYQNLPVILVSSGAPCDYMAEGPTHHCYNDIALMQMLPNMTVYQPKTLESLTRAIESSLASDSPSYIRLMGKEGDVPYKTFMDSYA